MHKNKQTKYAKSIRKIHKEQVDLWEMNKNVQHNPWVVEKKHFNLVELSNKG